MRVLTINIGLADSNGVDFGSEKSEAFRKEAELLIENTPGLTIFASTTGFGTYVRDDLELVREHCASIQAFVLEQFDSIEDNRLQISLQELGKKYGQESIGYVKGRSDLLYCN